MASNDAGTPTDSQNAADDENIKTADTTPDDERQGPDTTSNAEPQEEDRSTPRVEQAKSKARRLTHKIRTVIPQQPKRRWGAFTATITAAAGLAAGWVIRRGRRPKPRWPRRPR